MAYNSPHRGGYGAYGSPARGGHGGGGYGGAQPQAYYGGAGAAAGHAAGRGPRRSGGRYSGGGGGAEQEADRIAAKIKSLRSTLFRWGDPHHGAGTDAAIGQGGAAQQQAKQEEAFNAQSEMHSFAKWIEGLWKDREEVKAAWRVMITEQPHKLPLHAALLGYMLLAPATPTKSKDAANKKEDADATVAAATGAAVNAQANSSADPDDSAEADLYSLGQGQEEKGHDGEQTAKDETSESKRKRSVAEELEAREKTYETMGPLILTDLIKAFQLWLDSRMWRNVRLSLHLFACLLNLRVVSAQSFRDLLGSFASVLDEPGVSAARGDRAAICVIEALCWAGQDALAGEAGDGAVEALADRIGTYGRSRKVEVELISPWLRYAGSAEEDSSLREESFESAVTALENLRAGGWQRPAFLPVPLELLPPALHAAVASREADIELPFILVPPDEEEDAGGVTFTSASLAAATNGASHLKHASKRRMVAQQKRAAATTKGEEEKQRAGAGPPRLSRSARWFAESVPSSTSPSGLVLRSLLADVVDLYEVNRKECARILFDFARWCRVGTFVGKSVEPTLGLCGDVEDEWQIVDGDVRGGWSLDDTLVETVLSIALQLPTPPHTGLFYSCLLREIVTLSPQTVAPAIGKSVRRVYGAMRTGRADGEVIRRFGDWFSVHLSNFAFQWAWKEWIPDMSLPSAHPRKAFARRVVELEVRLAYWERVKGTLPPEIAEGVLPAQEPTPTFTYAAEGHPHREAALALIQSFRARATAQVIMANMDALKTQIVPDQQDDAMYEDAAEAANDGKVRDEREADILVRDIIFQAILSVGSRSFSHFLNVVERYHALLRQLSSTPELRKAILASVVRFWARSPQWVQIVFDKLLQYRIVEPTDIIDFVFQPSGIRFPDLVVMGSGDGVEGSFSRVDSAAKIPRDWSNASWWDIVRLTVEKVNGRVDQVRKRLEALEREEAAEEEQRAAAQVAGDEERAKAEQEPAPAPAPEPKLPLFPGASLPPRPPVAASPMKTPSAPPPAKKAQGTSAEAKVALEAIQAEQRKVMLGTTRGFAMLLKASQGDLSSAGPMLDEHTSQEAWLAWWVRAWYRDFARLFAKQLAASNETITSLVLNELAPLESDAARDIFDRAVQMASE
ncbi:Nuclear cap-binding complex, subunit NCBP1/CBP80 [Ceraceosorus bombacis]|uniref:Nuclear cap-binding complex, subunit NCBP1/CBP80 n=1 Tax=Ceraceosorus bombacis TaxID=401625 RepID=A0A0P1BIA5_9BASI|nr:Nuclear cap-binding complex, subunit NCBP1/CBP80 [Ceraceosorus bombacis]